MMTYLPWVDVEDSEHKPVAGDFVLVRNKTSGIGMTRVSGSNENGIQTTEILFAYANGSTAKGWWPDVKFWLAVADLPFPAHTHKWECRKCEIVLEGTE